MNRTAKYMLSVVLGCLALVCLVLKGGGHFFQAMASMILTFGSVFMFDLARLEMSLDCDLAKIRGQIGSSYIVAMFFVWIISSIVIFIEFDSDIGGFVALSFFGLFNIALFGGLIFVFLINPVWFLWARACRSNSDG